MAGFGQTPTTGTQPGLSTNQFPISGVAVPGKANGDLTALKGGPETTDSNGNKLSASAVYIYDGEDATQGLIADVAVTGDNSGTLSAKLRGLIKIWTDIWDSVNHRIKVDGSGVTQPVSGSLSVSNFPGTQPISGTVAATQSGTWTIQPGNTPNTVAWKVDGSAVTQPVSGTFWQATQPVSGTFWQATQPVSGTVSVNALPSGTNLIGSVELVDSGGTNKAAIDVAGNQQVKGGFSEQGSLSAGSLNADLVASADVSAYKWFSIQVTGVWSGTLTLQGCNDNSNFVNIEAASIGSFSAGINTTTTNGTFHGPIGFRYLRIRMTAYTSGTANGTLELYTTAPPLVYVGAAAQQNGTWTTVPNAATSGGSTPFHLVSAASTNATSVKASTGQVYNYSIINTNAAIRYVHLYNKASAPTVGTDTPVKTFLVPATGQISGTFPVGSAFATGIALGTTVSSGDGASDAVGAGDLIIDLDTK